jgi:hypothetical protein
MANHGEFKNAHQRKFDLGQEVQKESILNSKKPGQSAGLLTVQNTL